MAHYSFQEELFEYDPADWARWQSDEPDFRRKLAEKSGCMGSTRPRIHQQHNFPETSYGGHLVCHCGFPQSGLVYENYYLSGRTFEGILLRRPHSTTVKIKGTQVLRTLLSNDFFRMFDRLYDLNEHTIGKQLEDVHVDICAVDVADPRVGFYEVKSNEERAHSDCSFRIHQKLCLGFIREIVSTLGARAFNAIPPAVETKLIAFVPKGYLHRIKPRSHPVDFLT